VSAYKAFRQKKVIEIQLEEDGPVHNYTLQTMVGKEKSDWQQFVSGRVKFNAAGKPAGVTQFDGLESYLISKCLLGPDGKPVPQATIDQWAAPLLTALFKECQDMNGMTTEGEAAAKK
jgi:hypothetical protein